MVICLRVQIGDSVQEARSTRARDKMIRYRDVDYCYCDDYGKKEVSFSKEVDMTLTSPK